MTCLAVRGWRLATGAWGLAVGDWRPFDDAQGRPGHNRGTVSDWRLAAGHGRLAVSGWGVRRAD